MRFLFNPNYSYSIAIIGATLLYTLGWSDLYPNLSAGLVIFIAISITVNILIGKRLEPIILNNKKKISVRPTSLWVVSIIFIPLYAIDYIVGGIPTVHVIIITFASFFCLLVFKSYLDTKKKSLILLHLIYIALIVVGRYRIFIFQSLITHLLLFFYNRNLFNSLKNKLVFGALGVCILYIFGYLGNVLKGKNYESGELILNIGEATDRFRDSGIPDVYFWTYLYATSPLANLQLNVQQDVDINISNIGPYIISEYFPDFIAKRIFESCDIEQIKGRQINSALNVSTVYNRSYLYFSWYGMIVMMLFIAVLPIFYLSFLKGSEFFDIGLITLVSVYILLIFDNMFSFSALSFQLFYPFFGKLRLNWPKLAIIH